jgi:hypothetical protein
MKVRLEAWEISEIIKAFNECFEEKDKLWLFGSRTDMSKRGGDIDLYIEVFNFNAEKSNRQKFKFWSLLQDKLGEQKIDIILYDPNQDKAIYKAARSQGVNLT